jgi:hypothetical protein
MPGASKGPVSVALPQALRREIEREAKKRGLGLSPALRVLAAERLREISDAEDLTRAQEWQRAQAWASWEDGAAARWADVEAAFDPKLAPKKKLKTRKRS